MNAIRRPTIRLVHAMLLAGCALPLIAWSQDKLTMMDTDGNGRITSEEQEAGAKARFDALDSNRDGNVSAMEMDAAGSNAMEGGLPSADKISAADADGDGSLSAAEHEAGSQAMYTQGDANKDGAIDAPEMEAAHAAMKRTLEQRAADNGTQAATTQASPPPAAATAGNPMPDDASSDKTSTDDTTQDDARTDTPTPGSR
jgi:EF hand